MSCAIQTITNWTMSMLRRQPSRQIVVRYAMFVIDISIIFRICWRHLCIHRKTFRDSTLLYKCIRGCACIQVCQTLSTQTTMISNRLRNISDENPYECNCCAIEIFNIRRLEAAFEHTFESSFEETCSQSCCDAIDQTDASAI